MTEDQIRALGPALGEYLDEFADCFAHPGTRTHLREYVRGQLSDLQRKSVEPIAHWAGVAPRTLQEFLSLSDWDQGRMGDRLQQIVVRDHADPQAIGIIDDSGHVKKGKHTACVQRQYCGRIGKTDNCVVSVHLVYASYDTRFRTMLDSVLYVPKSWLDPQRRAETQMPAEATYRPKHEIALELLARAKANGVRFGWITADEWYSDKPRFVEGLEALGERFMLEIRRNLRGWLYRPGERRRPGREVETRCRHSRGMRDQSWRRFHIKDTGRGAMVWEVKVSPFWMERAGRVVGPYRLVVARNVLDPTEVKYFLSNASADTPLEVLLHVGFARWPVERCLEDEKSELGLSHFEVRKYRAVMRHLLLTQVSHLFLMRQTERLRGEKSGDLNLPGAHGQSCAAGQLVLAARCGAATSASGQPGLGVYATAERQGEAVAHAEASGPPRGPGDSRERTPVLHTAGVSVAL